MKCLRLLSLSAILLAVSGCSMENPEDSMEFLSIMKNGTLNRRCLHCSGGALDYAQIGRPSDETRIAGTIRYVPFVFRPAGDASRSGNPGRGFEVNPFNRRGGSLFDRRTVRAREDPPSPLEMEWVDHESAS